MSFKRTVQNYGRTPEPQTPYQRAGQLWDERIGSARIQARNWRIMAFGALGLAGAMASGLIWLSTQSRVVPYVVAVDNLGAPQAVSEAQRAYRPTDPQIAWALSQFIRHVRGASLDPVVTRDAWLEAYAFATERGARFLNEYARSSGALTRIGERTVSVQVTSVVRASDKSFQVKWREDVYERGSLEGSSRWTAILTIVEKSPRDAQTLRRNPLGIYIDAIDWSRELDPQAEGGGEAQRSSSQGSSSLQSPNPQSLSGGSLSQGSLSERSTSPGSTSEGPTSPVSPTPPSSALNLPGPLDLRLRRAAPASRDTSDLPPDLSATNPLVQPTEVSL